MTIAEGGLGLRSHATDGTEATSSSRHATRLDARTAIPVETAPTGSRHGRAPESACWQYSSQLNGTDDSSSQEPRNQGFAESNGAMTQDDLGEARPEPR